jgi:pilus assembly protein TadC
VTVLAVVLAAVAAAVAASRPGLVSKRLPRPPRSTTGRRRPSAQLACVAAGLAVAVVSGSLPGVVTGSVVALVGPSLLVRLESEDAVDERLRLRADLPLMLDLMAACLTSGASLEHACAAVADAIGGPGGGRLRAVSAALAVGLAPGEAWLALADNRAADPLSSAARLLGRAAEGGTPVAAAVGRLAADAREASRAAAAASARRVGVLVVAPLGLCFLPAFVLLGIAPVVVGLAGPLLATL